ncbi:putative aminophospholipid-translocase [Xylographa opegraphella]|nr:putative aminophospholipid-translocase [Xylographa opegraphella]
MSRAHQYHQPNAPNSYPDDPDSDIEIDLQELGPRADHEGGQLAHQSQGRNNNGRGDHDGPIPLRNLRSGVYRSAGRRTRRFETNSTDTNTEAAADFHQEAGREDSSESYNVGDATPLLNDDTQVQTPRGRSGWFGRRFLLPSYFSKRSGYVNIDANDGSLEEKQKLGVPRSISVGQYPPPRFPPNAVSNAKYTPWGFLPRTLYNEFSFFINMYFLLVSLSQVIPQLRIGVLWSYIVPLALVLTLTLGKEAYDDIARRRRDGEANKEPYTILRLRDNSKDPRPRKNGRAKAMKSRKKLVNTSHHRLDAIVEEEEDVGQNDVVLSNIEVDEIRIRSRDLKVGDVVKLGKGQRVPADLVILQSHTTESATSIVASVGKDIARSMSASSLGELKVETSTSTSITASEQVAMPENLQPVSDGSVIGETFIRTDQLDGETDWKLRLASPLTQTLDPREFTRLTIIAGKPARAVNEFLGKVELSPRTATHFDQGTALDQGQIPVSTTTLTAPLTIDNTAWANTVVASSTTILAVVVYTGAQTRQALSTSSSRSKVGLLELEINNLTKILCILTLTLSAVLVGIQSFYTKPDRKWYVSVTRFLILFSTIIPLSLRVNLDLAKSVYAWFIERDHQMPGAVVRTSTIPEDLGRIEYLLSDKTGTLTQNEMDLRKIHVGTVSYANEAMEEVASYVRQGFSNPPSIDSQQAMLVTPSSLLNTTSAAGTTTRTRREIGSRVRDVVLALALCHNVTPTSEEENGHTITTYQASSPDEIAIVRWTESVGLRVIHRDRHSIALQSVDSGRIAVRVRILDVFPFTSDGKRMGIIVQFLQGAESSASASTELGEIWFYQKGADTVMTTIVAANDWLDEETANMAREGLRTLVVGRRKLSALQYADFTSSYKEASMTLQSRDANMAQIIKSHLENNLELLGVTGVEDKLQDNVKSSLELLRNAGIKIWMLTGDKVETARCVAISSKLVSRAQHIHTITSLHTASRASPTAASDTLSLLAANPDSTALLIDGDSLSYLLTNYRHAFISLAVLLPAVIACRCSPTQKADVALLIRSHTKKRIACVGDGGNDVSMIQAADVGVGIVGKEGRQASLAADFSITQFHHLTKLLLWHGRNSYKRSAKLAQFVIHRGLLISVCQTVYSIATHYEPNALFRDWLLIGYSTVYTQFSVFSLVLDRDVDEALANLYPELYKELTPGTSLSYRTFFVWLFVSIYQGTLIQYLSEYLVGSATDGRLLAVSFSALVINELVMVAMSVTTWHWIMIASILGTAALYVGTVPFLGSYFDLAFVWTWGFVWRVAAILAVSLIPPYVIRVVGRTLRPPSYRKVRGV